MHMFAFSDLAWAAAARDAGMVAADTCFTDLAQDRCRLSFLPVAIVFNARMLRVAVVSSSR